MVLSTSPTNGTFAGIIDMLPALTVQPYAREKKKVASDPTVNKTK
jgi:hypothetical protein